MSLTKDLLERDRNHQDLATQHPFLVHAAKGTIAPQKLAEWLVQDEHYVHAYTPFIGRLMSKLELPTTIPLGRRNESLHHRILDVLIAASANIRREETFFAETIRDYGLQEHAKEEPPNFATESYLKLFHEVGTRGSLLDGMILLWGTEYVYLTAWKYAASQATGTVQGGPSAAVREKFIPNWTSKEFEEFVMELGGLVDELALATNCTDISRGSGPARLWSRILSCEMSFWPESTDERNRTHD